MAGGAPPPPSRDIKRVQDLRKLAEDFRVEGEALWDGIQAAHDSDDSGPKVTRLKGIQAEIARVSQEFCGLVNGCPELSLHVRAPDLCSRWSGPGVSVPDPTLAAAAEQSSKTIIGAPVPPVSLSKPGLAADTGRRKSMFTTTSYSDIGGVDAVRKATGCLGEALVHMATVPTRSKLFGELECVLLEPRVKVAAPTFYQSTGVVVCLQGVMPPSRETLREWTITTHHAEWTQMGASVAIPNVQVSSALDVTDIGDIVDGICEYLDADRVLLVGKDLLAPLMIGLGGDPNYDRTITGIVLLAPSSPPQYALKLYEGPMMLLWAQDDEVMKFDRLSGAWEEAIRSESCSSVATCCIWSEEGGHSFDEVVAQPQVGEALRHFFLAALLTSDLKSGVGNEQREARIDKTVSYLPRSIQRSLREECVTSDTARREHAFQELCMWISTGMRSLSSSE